MADSVAEKLEQLQVSISNLETAYAEIARTYYNMFYNPEKMDIILNIYDENGELKEVKVPNRAKDASDIYQYAGKPEGNQGGTLGSLCFDTVNKTLYFKTDISGTTGWTEVLTTDNFKAGRDFLTIDGQGKFLKDIDADHITNGTLKVENGGTGVGRTDHAKYEALNGIIKCVPEVRNNKGEVVEEAYFTSAIPGVDYMSLTTMTGLIAYSATTYAPEGFLVCDGAKYLVSDYPKLYDVLTTTYNEYGQIIKVECPFGDNKADYDKGLADEHWFRVPNLIGLFVRGWKAGAQTYDTDKERKLGSIQRDAIPNIKGEWVQEITGIPENYFNGAISIGKDADGKPIQVNGKSSAPAGSYDYLIRFDASDYNELYQDDIQEIRVRNIALLPIIKYDIALSAEE